MEQVYKSRRTLKEEHRHDDYRMYNRLVKSLLNYEDHIDAMEVLFRSKYTEEELLKTLEQYQGDQPEQYLLTRKDSMFRDFLIRVSDTESLSAHSCMVVRSHNPLNVTKRSLYKWLYYSLEEYLTEIYNRGDDFVLYLTHLNELVLKREDEFEYLVPIFSSGEMTIRAMKHDPTRNNQYKQNLYMMYTVLANPDLYGDAKTFIDAKYTRKKPKSIWTLNKLKRCKYTSYRKYAGEE